MHDLALRAKGTRKTFPWRTVLLAIILALHFVSRFEAHQTTPLRVRHFYPTS